MARGIPTPPIDMPFLDDLAHGALFLGLHLGSLGVIAASAWIFGLAVLERGPGIKDAWARWALATALGLGLIAQSTFVLGILGLLEREVVLAALLLAHLLCHRTWRAALARWRGAWRCRRSTGRWAALRLTLGLLILAPAVVLALYPPTSFDATHYHLPFVKSFIAAQRLVFLPELRVPVFPVAVEMDFVLGFFLSGDVAAKLTQLLAVLATAGLIFAWGRHSFSRRAGLWAAALWLGVPLVVYNGASAYVDCSLALFVTAGFFCWERWDEDGDRRWLWLAGIFAGLAAAAKYLGLFFCGALLWLTALRALKSRALRPVVTLALAAAVTAAPWYLRIVYHTGNPVFPFYPEIFGDSEWTIPREVVYPPDVSGPESAWAGSARRTFEGLGFLLLVPWNGVFNRGVFHLQPPLSPFYLALLPLCVPLALRAPPARRLLLLAGAYGLFWLLIYRDVRYLVPVLPMLHLGLAAGLERAARWAATRRIAARWAASRAAAWGLAALLLAPGPSYAAYKIHQRGRLPTTPGQRHAYLSDQLPGYAAVRWLNEAEGERYTVYALFGERLRYFADGRYLGDRFGRTPFSRIQAVMGDGRALYRELRGLGAGYFLVVGSGPWARLPEDAFFQRSFELVLAGPDFVLYRLRVSS